MPKDELHYLKRVRREQGEVELFNSEGQVAHGQLEGDCFVVSGLKEVAQKDWPLHIAIGLPEMNAIQESIRSLSELGVERLSFFSADRSQSPKARMSKQAKWRRIAIESARQCGRAKPLELEARTLEELLAEPERKLVFDESDAAPSVSVEEAFSTSPLLCFIGPEGGWSPRERDLFREKSLKAFHLSTPVLKVSTAAAAAATCAVLQWSKE